MAKEQDVLVWQLVQASDFFLKKAHSISSKALQDASGRTLDEYNTLIKACLNCLFKILRHYSAILDAKLQSILYYKTAQILFKETISLDLALDYCNKGIQICKRNEPNLTSIKLKLQYLNFQIQFQCNNSPNLKKQTLAYLNNILQKEIPEDASYLNIKVLFSLVKFKHFNSIYTPERNVTDLKRMQTQLQSNLSKENYLFLQLILINLIELQLLNNFPLAETKRYMDELKKYQASDNPFGVKTPVQFQGATVLFEVLISLYEFQFEKATENIQKVDFFNKSFKQSTHKSWPSKLLFSFHLENDNSIFPVEFSWLSFKDFSLISYLCCGILCSYKSWEKKSKSDKIFKLVTSSLSTEVAPSMSAFEDVQLKRAKQNYLKILTSAYQLLSDFVKDKFPILSKTTTPASLSTVLHNYEGLFEFMESYEKNNYSAYECAVYDNLMPLVHYIFAMIYQRNGIFYKALYHHSIARISCCKSNSLSSTVNPHPDSEIFNDPIYADFIQSNMGILGAYSQSLGSSNEIYVLSTLNSLPIIHYLIEQEKHKQKDLSEFDIGYDSHLKRLLNLLKMRDSLGLQINQILQKLSSTQSSPNSSLSVLHISISMLCYFYTTQDYNFLSNIDLEKISEASPLLTSFLYLIMGYTYKTDPGLTELENLNLRVGFYTSACKYSAKACGPSHVNKIAQLGYLEIWKIMNHNKNLYTSDSIAHVYDKYKHFAHDIHRDSDDIVEEKGASAVKRVKFA